MQVGTFVKIKDGATAWMKDHGYWIHDWPESIDGMIGEIVHDYTEYKGDDCHYEVALPGIEGCGVHPQWLIANAAGETRGASPRSAPPACSTGGCP